MSLRCWFGQHKEGGLVSGEASGVFGARRCLRCFHAIGGVTIDAAPPTVTQPVALPQPAVRGGISWIRAVYVKSEVS